MSRRQFRPHSAAPYLFLLPFLVTFGVFMVYPLVKSVWWAFHQTYGPEYSVFVGFGNFIFMFQDPSFWRALRNTTVFAFASIFIQLPLALGLALLLDSKWVRGREFFRLAFFSPSLMGQAFVGILFGTLFVPRYGLVNRVFAFLLGMNPDTRWLGDSSLVMPALIMTALWMYGGFNMIYFLAALQAVDPQLYEAADIDGAGALQKFWHVTVPAIKPVAIFVVILSTIGSYKLFELAYILLNNGAGPQEAGLTVVMYLFQTGFGTGDLGYVAAIGWVLVLITFGISIAQLRFGREREAA